jgi:Rrf2 family protein
MFKVSRKSEYALIAVQHLARRSQEDVTSVTELAYAENIPADILAKVLQGLKRAGILSAVKGAGGGYKLSRPVHDIYFLDVVRPFEEQLAVVNCQIVQGGCARDADCTLRDPMAVLNAFLMRQFSNLTMDSFLSPHRLVHGAQPDASEGGPGDVSIGSVGLGRWPQTNP